MKNIILFVSLCFPFISFCQLDEGLQLSGKSWSELQKPVEVVSFRPLFALSLNTFDWNKKIPVQTAKASVLCQKYEGKAASAFFCRMENRLEKKVRFPIRMRVGTLDYVDGLEGK